MTQAVYRVKRKDMLFPDPPSEREVLEAARHVLGFEVYPLGATRPMIYWRRQYREVSPIGRKYDRYVAEGNVVMPFIGIRIVYRRVITNGRTEEEVQVLPWCACYDYEEEVSEGE